MRHSASQLRKFSQTNELEGPKGDPRRSQVFEEDDVVDSAEADQHYGRIQGPIAIKAKKPENFVTMIDAGYLPGMGRSSSPGWFSISGLDRDARTADEARLIRSCTDEEAKYVFDVASRFDYVPCRARLNYDDILLVVIEFRG